MTDKRMKILTLIYHILAMAFQTVLLLAMIYGMSSCFGTRTSFLNIANFTFSIFYITESTALICLSRIALSIVYVVAISITIKNIVMSIRTNVSWLKGKIKHTSALSLMMQYNGSTLFVTFLFLSLSLQLSRLKLGNWVLALIATGVLLVCVGIIFYRIFTEQIASSGSLVFNIIKLVAVFGLLGGIGYLLANPNFYLFVTNLKYLPTLMEDLPLYSLYICLLEPILTMILVGIFLRAAYTVICLEDVEQQKSATISMIVFSAILLTLACIFKTFFVTPGTVIYFSSAIFSNWLSLTKAKELPLTLFSVAYLLSATTLIPAKLFQTKKPTLKEAEEDAEKEQEKAAEPCETTEEAKQADAAPADPESKAPDVAAGDPAESPAE